MHVKLCHKDRSKSLDFSSGHFLCSKRWVEMQTLKLVSKFDKEKLKNLLQNHKSTYNFDTF